MPKSLNLFTAPSFVTVIRSYSQTVPKFWFSGTGPKGNKLNGANLSQQSLNNTAPTPSSTAMERLSVVYGQDAKRKQNVRQRKNYGDKTFHSLRYNFEFKNRAAFNNPM